MYVKPSLLQLCPVTTSDSDIDELFQLLERRQFGISHGAMPAYKRHREFVLSHPYRAWYFVQYDTNTVGSLYLLDSNHIGINMIGGYAECIKPAVDRVCELHKPLPPIASVRSGRYSVNVAPQNIEQIDALEAAGAVLIQQTYQLP